MLQGDHDVVDPLGLGQRDGIADLRRVSAFVAACFARFVPQFIIGSRPPQFDGVNQRRVGFDVVDQVRIDMEIERLAREKNQRLPVMADAESVTRGTPHQKTVAPLVRLLGIVDLGNEFPQIEYL